VFFFFFCGVFPFHPSNDILRSFLRPYIDPPFVSGSPLSIFFPFPKCGIEKVVVNATSLSLLPPLVTPSVPAPWRSGSAFLFWDPSFFRVFFSLKLKAGDRQGFYIFIFLLVFPLPSRFEAVFLTSGSISTSKESTFLLLPCFPAPFFPSRLVRILVIVLFFVTAITFSIFLQFAMPPN